MSEIYLKIDSIKGDADTSGFEDQIHVASVEVVNKSPVVEQTSGANRTTGTANAPRVKLVKSEDLASPLILSAYNERKNLGTITFITVANIEGKNVVIKEVKYHNAIVVSQIGMGDSSDDLDQETVEFTVSAVEMTVNKYKDGRQQGSTSASWNYANNTPSV